MNDLTNLDRTLRSNRSVMGRTIGRGYFGMFTVFAATVLLCVLAASSAAAAGTTTLVSVDDSGVQGSGSESDISDDGSYVAFVSTSSNLVAGDTNGVSDVFVRDRLRGTTERVSVDDDGKQANGNSRGISISATGRYVAFVSEATNLVPNDTNGVSDVFVRDLQTDTTKRVSERVIGVDALGNEIVIEANGESYWTTDVSTNGRVAFASMASNLVADDTNNFWDFFVHDLNTRKTKRVNVDESGNQVNGGVSLDVSISANGRYVGFTTSAPYLDPNDPGDHWDGFVRDLDPAEGQTQTIWRVAYDASGAPRISDNGRVVFTSYATKLVANDTNGFDDIFVRDLPAGTIDRVSEDSDERQANGRSYSAPAISSDGRYVAFVSEATNLVPNDTNGFRDVFVRDLQDGTTEQVSVGRCAAQANGHSSRPSISSKGGYVAFTSSASNLVADDTNIGGDIFVRERLMEPDTLPSECIAPTTTASASTSSGAPYESGTWTNEDVKLTFSAQDNQGGSGIKDIRYSATGADAISQQTVAADDLPATFTIDAEGTTTVRYLATDKEGNVESPAKTFTVKIDKSPPTVDSVYPADAATDVDPWGYAEASFSEAMDPDTLTPSTFTLTKQGSSTPVEAKVSYETYDATDHYAWLETSSELVSNTTYTATIKGGASGAKDLVGNALQEDYSWSFTTAPPDTQVPSPPVINSPANNSIDADGNFTISGTAEANSTVELFEGLSFLGTASVNASGEWSKSLTGVAEGSHTYTATATDAAHNTSEPSVPLTVVVKTPPVVTSVSPVNQSQNVAISTNIEATFSEVMDSSTLTTSTLTLTKQNSSTPVTATVSNDSTNKATLNPSSDLASKTTYTARIKGGASGAKDSAGNALAQDYSWSFTTGPPPDTTAPKVSAATPTGTGVARGSNAIATFSERMDPTTITTSTFKLFKCSSTTSTNCATQITNVTISRSTDRLKATLNPYGTSSTLLAGRTKYKVVVTTGAKDEAGNQLDQDPSMAGNQDKVWYFTAGRS